MVKNAGGHNMGLLKFNNGVCKEGRKIKLADCKEGKNQLLTEDKHQSQLKELQTYCIQVVPWQEEAQCYALNL